MATPAPINIPLLVGSARWTRVPTGSRWEVTSLRNMPSDEPASGKTGSQGPTSRSASGPAYWLFKQEPECYSFAQLVEDGQTNWDGVENALARKHLRAVKKGDRAYFYETGKRKAIVGLMEIAGAPAVDPDSEDGKGVLLKVKPLRSFEQPVTLAEIKADPVFADWELVRVSRLSVMPVSNELVRHLEKHAEIKRESAKKTPDGSGALRPKAR